LSTATSARQRQKHLGCPCPWILASPVFLGNNGVGVRTGDRRTGFLRIARARPRWQESILQRLIKPAALRAGIGKIGWHTFRHSYSSLLRRVGADIKVQQELLRHSTIQSTMNVYTQAMPEGKRAVNSVVVRSVLPFEACCGISRKLKWEPIATGELVSGCGGWI